MDLTWFFGYFFSGTDVDIDFVGWLVWLFTPLMVIEFQLFVCVLIISFNLQITFLLPCIIILLFYMSALIVFIYRHRHKLDLSKIVDEIEHQRYWNGAVYAVCSKFKILLVRVFLQTFDFSSPKLCGRLMVHCGMVTKCVDSRTFLTKGQLWLFIITGLCPLITTIWRPRLCCTRRG